MKTLIPLLIVLGGTALFLFGCQASRAGYESAPYKLVRTDGKFELRDYPALLIVETAESPAGSDSGGGFNRLFRFITGRNEPKQKIAMTTPVLMAGADSNRTMAFVLPAKLKTGEVPKPLDPAVTVREVDAGRFAVLRYSGTRNAAREEEALGRLKAWLAAQGLKDLAPAVFAYFDPPWTPAPLRRNEVMLRIGSEKR